MTFCNLDIKSEYGSLSDKVVQNFYLPLLKEAVLYKRAVGYFSSSCLVELSKGIAGLVKNGGKIQIIASPCLSPEDVDAIRLGYKAKEEIIEDVLLRELDEYDEDYFSIERLNLLANLIAKGILDIKIAITDVGYEIGIYHEKMGIIEDREGNKVAFSGSMNETRTGMSLNFERIDVFRSWVDSNDAGRVESKIAAFDQIWNDNEPTLKVFEFPKITNKIIEKFKVKPENLNIDEEQFPDFETNCNKSEEILDNKSNPKLPKDLTLYDYQKDAISNWVSENYRGIFLMATGTGKTLTGLAAVERLARDVNYSLALIIVCPFQHLVEQWVEDIVRFNIEPIIAYSTSKQRDWKDRLKQAILDQKLRRRKGFFCLITTNATFNSSFVQEQINRIKKPIMLLADEAHNLGASSLKNKLDDRFNYRLALSATLDRHNDEEGTQILYNFFGKKCIDYSLARAIEEKKLTPYKYFPILVTLNEYELEEYEKKSKEISKHIIKASNGKIMLDEYGKLLAIQRSRIVAAASGKLDALREIMVDYKDDNFLLVYCGAASLFDDTYEESSVEQGDIKQIDAVCKILGGELGMKVSKFTSEENMSQRNLIKEHFKTGDELQAIVAIKCLDEGFNIPSIKTAFILASTTNPKEYIQRRGRVLRLSPQTNKKYAEIYDFITLTRPLDDVFGLLPEQRRKEMGLARSEYNRMREFSGLSMNPESSLLLMNEIKEAFDFIDDISEGEEELWPTV